MRSVKIDEAQGDKVKDLKKYLRKKEELDATEAEIFSKAVKLSLRHYDELVEELKDTDEKKGGVVQHILENPESGEESNAAEDHDTVGL